MKRIILSAVSLAERVEDELYVLMDSNGGSSKVKGLKTGNIYRLNQQNGSYILTDSKISEKFDYLSQVANYLVTH